MNINGYTLKAELKNANSGFSKWGFGTKNGKEYFIKELINPVYPIDKNIMSEELFQQRRAYCSQYEVKFKKFFEEINKASHGNLVRINEFFRCDSHYYLVSEKVEGKSPSMEYIASLEDETKLLLLKTVARCFYDLHSAGIVHFDVKPNNILVKAIKGGNYVAKLIDFDSGFFKGEILDNKELGGDLTYLAPETFLGIYGEDVHPDEKADIFGLGLVFHQYYCGILPYYDENEYEYPYEAALDGGLLKPDMEMMPEDVGNLIASMLDAEPKKRPSAEEIIKTLNTITEQSDRSLEITQIMLHFDGAFGKSISITPDSIKYKNTVHPSVKAEMESQKEYYPEDYLVQKKRPVADESVYDSIIGKVVDAGLWDLVTLSELNESSNDKICQAIKVICKDGTVYSYSTEGAPNSEFVKIVSILSKYCTFPVKLDYIPSKSENEEKKITENKNGEWFKQAGDL